MSSTSNGGGGSGNDIILAISSLPAVNASLNCKSRCSQQSRCIAVVMKNTLTSMLHVQFMCTPDPAMILSTVYPTGLDSFDLVGSDVMTVHDGAIISHIDILWNDYELLYIVVYVFKSVSTISLSAENNNNNIGGGGSGTSTASSSSSVLHEVHLWKPDWQGGSYHTLILTSNDLASELLTLPVQRGLFEGNTITKPQISGCSIQCIFPVDSNPVKTKLVFFISFTAQIKGWIPESVSLSAEYISSDGSGGSSSSNGGGVDNTAKKSTMDSKNMKLTQAGYTLRAIVTWCDPTSSAHVSSNIFTLNNKIVAPFCSSKNLCYVPCPYTCPTDVDSTCGGICNAGLDRAILLGNSGTFIKQATVDDSSSNNKIITASSDYLFLPSMNSNNNYADILTTRLVAQLITIDPFYGAAATPKSTFPLLSSGDSASASTSSSYYATIGVLGTWTRQDIFSPLSMTAMQKSILDTITHLPSSSSSSSYSSKTKPKMPLFAYFFQANQEQSVVSGQWLQEVRPSRGTFGWQFLLFKSQQTSSKLQLNINCTHLSCGGCSTSRLRLLCHAAQDCTLSKCIGTTVQTRNVLCGIGNLVERTGVHAIVTWRAVLSACIEMSLLAMRGLSGEIMQRVTLRFPTDQFYALICSCKDMFATLVGVGMSVGNMLSSSFTSGHIQLNSNQDVGILIGESTLKSRSMGGLFFNLVSSATLLPTMALHRWLICMANSSQVAQSEGSMSIQFGDVSMDTSWLPCAKVTGLTDMLNNDDLTSSVSSAVQLFVSFTVALLSGIGDTILFGMQLSFDSTIDYIVGLIWNIQDILFAYNMRSCKNPNYAQRYVMQCACGDMPYTIPQPQRSQKKISDGAMWCTGTLSMPLIDGNIGIIYNPYSLDELSVGVSEITKYIQCLNWSATTGDTCKSPLSSSSSTTTSLSTLQILIDQAVEPIAVWARCKSNYMHSTWDIGAGVLFSGENSNNNNIMPIVVTTEIADEAIKWASDLSPEFLACLQV